MPAEQAQALIEYLKVNPQAAKAAYDQAQAILANPAMAQAFMNMNVSTVAMHPLAKQSIEYMLSSPQPMAFFLRMCVAYCIML